MKISYDTINPIYVSGATIGVDAAAYEDNDLVGDLITLESPFPEGKGGFLMSLCLQDLTTSAAALECYIFDKYPVNTTFTDESALDIDDTDLTYLAAHFSIAASDYLTLADNCLGYVKDLNIPLKSRESGQANSYSGNLWACFRTAGSTPTYVANGLSAVFTFMSDPA